jgi:pyruvate dehydrogenase E1 component alpha subunit
VTAIRNTLAPVVDRVRTQREPQVVVFHTLRLGPHSKGDDTRPPEQVSALRTADWLASYSVQMPARVAAADTWARSRIDAALADVLARPQSTWAAR